MACISARVLAMGARVVGPLVHRLREFKSRSKAFREGCWRRSRRRGRPRARADLRPATVPRGSRPVATGLVGSPGRKPAEPGQRGRNADSVQAAGRAQPAPRTIPAGSRSAPRTSCTLRSAAPRPDRNATWVPAGLRRSPTGRSCSGPGRACLRGWRAAPRRWSCPTECLGTRRQCRRLAALPEAAVQGTVASSPVLVIRQPHAEARGSGTDGGASSRRPGCGPLAVRLRQLADVAVPVTTQAL